MARNAVLTGRILGWVGLAYALSGAVGGYPAARERFGWVGVGLLVSIALAAGICYLVVMCRPRSGSNMLLLVAVAVGGVGMQAVSPYSGLGFAFVLPWIAVFTVSLRNVVVVGLFDAVGVLVVLLALGFETGAVIGITLGLLFSFAFAIAVGQLSTVKEQTEAIARAQAREAVLGERARLAREMHDILAHSLSAQIVHLEGARLLLERGGDHADALDRVTRAGQLARAGLDETRRALDTLRGDELNLVDRLELLAAEFRTATGASCEVTVADDPEQLSPEARLAVIRTAQEALTNVRKHAPGAHVTVALRCQHGWYELDVQDTGGSPGELAELGGGYGLVGMRERAELIGGRLDAHGNGSGFGVLLRVPA